MHNPVDLRRRPRPGGFTLFEVVIVLGLLSVLSALVLPAVARWQSGLPMQRAETEVRDVLLRCRTAAITTGRPSGFQFQAGRSDYRTIQITPAGQQTTERRLAGNIRFGRSAAGAGWSPPILFSADGIAADTVIPLSSETGERSRLRLRRLTGNVTVEPDE